MFCRVSGEAPLMLVASTGIGFSYDVYDSNETKSDTKVYPSPEMMGKLFAREAMPLNIDRVRTRLWKKIRTGELRG